MIVLWQIYLTTLNTTKCPYSFTSYQTYFSDFSRGLSSVGAVVPYLSVNTKFFNSSNFSGRFNNELIYVIYPLDLRFSKLLIVEFSLLCLIRSCWTDSGKSSYLLLTCGETFWQIAISYSWIGSKFCLFIHQSLSSSSE